MKKNSKNDNSDIKVSLDKLDELMNTRSLNELEYTKENAFKILSRKDLMNASRKVQSDYRRSPLVDKVFKIIFENSSNKRFTALLISCVTGLDYDYILENMEFYKNDINNDSIEERQMHGDLMINLKGTFIGIEMNNYNRIGRNILYSVKTSMVDENRHQDIKIYPIIQINLNNYSYREIDKVMSVYALLDIDTQYQNHVKIKNFQVEVYLPKLREKEYTSLSKEERVLLAMFETSQERASILIKEDKLLMDYEEMLKTATKKPEIIEAYDHDAATREGAHIEGYKEGFMEGKRDGKIEGKAEGRVEGIVEGKIEGKIEAIKTLFSNGLDFATIAKYMNMEVAEIEKIALSK